MNNSKLNNNFKNYITVIVILIIAGFMSYTIINNFDDLRNYEIRFNFFKLIISIFCNMVGLLLFSYGWFKILTYNDESIDFRTSNNLWVISSFGKYIPGRIWQFTGRIFLFNKQGISKTQIIIYSVYEQIYFLVSAIILFLITSFFFSERFTGIVLSKYSYVAILFLSFSLLIINSKILNIIFFFTSKFSTRFKLYFNLQYKHSLIIIIIYLLGWLIIGIGFSLFISSIIKINFNDIVFLIGANAIAYVIGYLVFVVPNGIGVREGILAILLKSFSYSGMNTILAVLSRLWYIFPELLYLILLMTINKINTDTFNIAYYSSKNTIENKSNPTK